MEEENMPEIRAHKRVTIGRNVILGSVVVYALIRALIRFSEPPEPNTVDYLVTYGGDISWAWATAWIIAAALCVHDIVRRHTRYGLSAVAGLCVCWGTAHLGQWIYYGFTGYGWVDALEWYMPAGLLIGVVIKVTALYDLARVRP